MIETRTTAGSESLHAERAPTLVIAEAHALRRKGVRRALESHGFQVLAEAADAELALEAVAEHQPDICLLDPELPGLGLQAMESLHARFPEMRIAALGKDEVDAQALELIAAGADGYLLKNTAPDRLAAAVWALARGEAALPRALTTELVYQYREVTTPEEHISRRSNPLARTALYVPRILRHYYRRRRSGMPHPVAWGSARQRMLEY